MNNLLISGGIAGLWWAVYFLLRTDKKYAFSISLVSVNLIWWLILVQNIFRFSYPFAVKANRLVLSRHLC